MLSAAGSPPLELVLLTQSYPFGSGETFLDIEVPALAAQFPKARVVPLHIVEGVRSLPPGWRIDTTLHDKRTANPITSIRASAAILRYELGANLLAPLSSSNYPQLRRTLRFVRTAAWVQQWFDATSIDLKLDRTIFYSYWFEAVAYGLGVLKARLPVRYHPSLRRIRILARAHRWDLYEDSTPSGYFPFRAVTLRRFDHVFPVSEHGVHHLKTQFGGAAGHVCCARLGVQPSPACPASSDGVLRVVSCSRLQPQKRLERLIDALNIVGQRYPLHSIHWTHMGDGPQGPQLKQYASTVLPQNINTQWLGDLKHPDVLRRLAQGPFDVFVNVSESEGVPVSIMEAFAAGLPVVATGVGGTPEILDNKVGRCLDVWSPEEAAQAIFEVGSPESNPSYRREAQKRWAERSNAAQLFTAFAEMIATS